MITSLSNKKVKNVSALLSKAKERKKQQLFVTEGIKMFAEAPLSWMREIYIEETLYFDYLEGRTDTIFSRKLKEVLNAEDAESLKTEVVSEAVFCKMSDTQTPQGILCVMKNPEYALEEILRQTDIPGLYLILEDIQDPGNLGTMMRTGEGAGISGIILSEHSVDMLNPKTVRATMGSIYRVPFCYVSNLEESIASVKKSGITVYAAHLEGKKAYDEFDCKKPVAFLIGNEGNGLSDEIAALADSYLKIPMLGRIESLNAAVASSLLIYEAARQRRNEQIQGK